MLKVRFDREQSAGRYYVLPPKEGIDGKTRTKIAGQLKIKADELGDIPQSELLHNGKMLSLSQEKISGRYTPLFVLTPAGEERTPKPAPGRTLNELKPTESLDRLATCVSEQRSAVLVCKDAQGNYEFWQACVDGGQVKPDGGRIHLSRQAPEKLSDEQLAKIAPSLGIAPEELKNSLTNARNKINGSSLSLLLGEGSLLTAKREGDKVSLVGVYPQ